MNINDCRCAICAARARSNGKDELQMREEALAEERATQKAEWLCISFAGKTFLGSAFIWAHGVVDATQRAWELGINPGGGVVVQEFPAHMLPPEPYRNRLLSKQELASLGWRVRDSGHKQLRLMILQKEAICA